MNYLAFLIGIIISYLLGAIPFGYLLVKTIKGEDIRKFGSGNIGAANVARVLGKGMALIALLLDAAKGFVSAYVIPGFFLPRLLLDTSNTLNQHIIFLGVLCGLSAILGHLFPIYLRFRGGKGVATGLGVTIAIMPQATGLAIVVWLIFILLFRYISLASIMAGLSLPFGVIFLVPEPFSERIITLIFSVLLADLIIIRHIPNMRRLVKGTEPKFGVKTR